MSAPTLPDYTLVRSRRKTLGLQVDQQGSIIVRAPLTTPQWRIRSFVTEQLSWIDRARQRQQKRLKNLPRIQEEDRERYAALAKQILPGKVAHYAAIMGVTPTGITVTGAKTRFGSCSYQNRLCFSWRLMAYPDEAIDYVVVHELAHIRHKNHSPAFYSFIEQVLPDYKSRIKMLKGM
ncbi:MAG: M48 family metallopeptidase [Clostridia bacterium]|nr:M48 family metallopeptidase [Clostridia bacterium]